jgi:hypothetical protein
MRRRAAVQMAYAALFVLFVLWPNLQSAPSLVLVVATSLAGIWLVGGLAVWARIPHADEILFCGSAAPLLVGVTQLAYRVHFLWTHGALTRNGFAEDSAGAFLAVWAAELLLVLLPGLGFVWWNARALGPVPPQPKRPPAASRRT